MPYPVSAARGHWTGAAAGISAPTDISGLVCWFDFSDAETLFTDAGTTPVSGDGQAIYRANDKSGNALYAQQTDAARRPTYKTNITNGLSVARYDGGDRVATASRSWLSTYTVFTVSVRSSGTGVAGICNVDAGTNRLFQHRYNDSNAEAIAFNTTPAAFTDAEAVTASNWNILAAVRRASNVQIYAGGTSNGSTATSGTNAAPSRRLEIGDAYQDNEPFASYLTGDIGEVVVYGFDLSAADLNAVGNYLADKWGITWNTVS